MNRRRSFVLAVLAVPALAACTSAPSTPAPAQTSYQCCDAKEIDLPYRPGQTMSLHWKVEPGDRPDQEQPSEVQLQANLTGPYESVTALKDAADKDKSGDVTYAAATVRPTGAVKEALVSSIVIKPDAKPGYYSLVTSVRQGPGEVSGATIVQVVPKV